eukprot:3413917-Prymnesium_polylepis.1
MPGCGFDFLRAVRRFFRTRDAFRSVYRQYRRVHVVPFLGLYVGHAPNLGAVPRVSGHFGKRVCVGGLCCAVRRHSSATRLCGASGM